MGYKRKRGERKILEIVIRSCQVKDGETGGVQGFDHEVKIFQSFDVGMGSFGGDMIAVTFANLSNYL